MFLCCSVGESVLLCCSAGESMLLCCSQVRVCSCVVLLVRVCCCVVLQVRVYSCIVLQVRVCSCASEEGHYLQSWHVQFYSLNDDKLCLHTCLMDTSVIVSCINSHILCLFFFVLVYVGYCIQCLNIVGLTAERASSP